jgi:hypothetical protein
MHSNKHLAIIKQTPGELPIVRLGGGVIYQKGTNDSGECREKNLKKIMQIAFSCKQEVKQENDKQITKTC